MKMCVSAVDYPHAFVATLYSVRSDRLKLIIKQQNNKTKHIELLVTTIFFSARLFFFVVLKIEFTVPQFDWSKRILQRTYAASE